MSDTVDADAPWLAAEYVLGVLDLAGMREAEARQATDPAFAADLLFWQERLGSLAALVPPVAPPPALWARLALATGIGGAASPKPARAWQAVAAVSMLVAASLALLLVLPRTDTTERFAAALAPLNSPARFLVQTRADGSLAISRLGAAAPPPGRDYQLWALPQGATAPISLGVIAAGAQVVAPGHAAPGEQLLVSEEPAGGSPVGAPTGPVVLGGTLSPVSPAGAPGR